MHIYCDIEVISQINSKPNQNDLLLPHAARILIEKKQHAYKYSMPDCLATGSRHFFVDFKLTFDI